MGDYILINDVHLKDRPPARCTNSYLDDLFDLLGEARTLAARPGVQAMVLAGDVFHDKTPARTSHSTVMRLIDWARSCPVSVWVVLGNHDLLMDRVASIDESQPLGVVIRSGAVRLLDGWDPSGYVFGVPWQVSFDDATVSAALQTYRTGWHYKAHTLVVTHAPLYPPGQELKYEFYPAANWADAMDRQGTVHYGHVHHPHGVYEVNGVQFSNCGALSRGSLTEVNTRRVPSVALWSSATGAVTHIELPAKPAQDVFRLVEAREQKHAELQLSTFLQAVQATQLDITDTDAVMRHIHGLDLEPALTATIAALLEQSS